MDELQVLVGTVIKTAEIIQDYLQLIFIDGSILNIYNNYRYKAAAFQSLTNKKIVSVLELSEKIVISIEDDGVLIISLSDKDYNGPEAMELIRKNEPTIVRQ